ncbi:sensor histidine kinase [Pseudactinotalea sp.]|uniref:sensor histidine kinase n=1 Tax=Pseudactinotalea sp. TaxID=1926260 RepID=UPI003B3A1E63
MTDAAEALTSHPWHRWGWLVGGVWLVFLLFPILNLLDLQSAPLPRVMGLTLIAAFAVLYGWGFVGVTRSEDGVPNGWRVLAVLTLLAAGTAAFIGIDALGMMPFLISYAMWGFRWPRGLWAASGFAAVAIVAIVAFGRPDSRFYLLPVLLVLGFTALMRVLDAFSARQAELSEVMAVVGERERVARDVHDVLGHSLTAISVKAELASRLIEVDGARAAEELDQVQTLAREALAEIRSTVSGLRATRIEDELEAARVSLTAAGIEADVPADAESVEITHRIVLAWALREATTNVIRHSGASRCVVELGPGRLVVTDDGVGASGAEGNGLRGLRERVSASGGTVTHGPGPGGRGHEVRVTL